VDSSLPGAPPEGASSGGFCPGTVFIVDREPLYRWFVAESLDRDGILVLEFAHVADAAGCPAVADPRTLLLIDGQTLRDEGSELLAALCRRLPALHYVVLEPAGPGPARGAPSSAPAAIKPVDCDTIRALVCSHGQYAP
jgi:DNA-binding NtrC family response regulator